MLLNLKDHRTDVGRIYLSVKDPLQSKYQLLINERQIGYLQTTDDDSENLEEYSPTKKRKVIKEFDYMIADLEANKILRAIVTRWFIRERKLNISLVFISQSYFKVPKV